MTLGVTVGPRQCIVDQLLAKADVIRAMRKRVQLCQDPLTEFALLRESLGVSRINHILRVHGHTILQEQLAAEIYDEVGSHGGQHDVSDTQCWPVRNRVQKSARHRCSCTPGRIQAMIQDAVCAGLLPEHLLETRFTAVIETATSTHLSVFMTKNKPRQSCMFRRQLRQQTKLGSRRSWRTAGTRRHKRPTIAFLEHPGSAPQDEDSENMDFSAPGRAGPVRRSSKRSFHG